MALNTEWDAVVSAVGAGVMALFGVWVLTLTPRGRQSVLLGLFAVVHGVSYAVYSLWGGFAKLSTPVGLGLDIASFAFATLALLGVAHEILRGQGMAGRGPWRMAWISVVVVSLASLQLRTLGRGRVVPTVSSVDWVQFGADAFVVAFAVLPLVFAWMYRRTPGALQARRLMLTLSVAFSLWPALAGSYGVRIFFFADNHANNFVAWHYRAAAAFVLATGVLWLFNLQLEPRLSRAARNAALTAFGLMALGAFDAVVLSRAFHYEASGGPFFGLARLATVVALTHAILNHQVLGMDVKLRFAISKSTIAAVFIAVFFIASEAAQQFFGEQFESGYLGIFAAGALVFAIAPLSRVADRLAEKTVPVAGPAAAVASSGRTGKEESYRKALRIALRDRKLTRAEETELHELAHDLGIRGPRAHALLAEAETEAGHKGRGR